MARSVARPLARAVIAALALAALVPHVSTMPARAAVAADPQCAGAATNAADTTAPTPPASFHVVSRTKSGSITLGWVASYDAVGVAGYKLYRNGSWTGTLCQAGVDLIGTVMYDRLGDAPGPPSPTSSMPSMPPATSVPRPHSWSPRRRAVPS